MRGFMLGPALRVASVWMTQLLVAESAVDQLFAVRERAGFVAKACGLHAAVAVALVCVAGLVKASCVVVRCVPSLAEERRAMRGASAAMVVTCAVETLVAVATGDSACALATAILGLLYVQHVLVLSSSRHLRVFTGIVDSRSSLSDWVTSTIRYRAMRYKLSAQAAWAISALLVYAYVYNTSLLSTTPLAQAMAWQEARCTAALIALVAGVGGADERLRGGEWGTKKAF
jgi:hypothetical protein